MKAIKIINVILIVVLIFGGVISYEQLHLLEDNELIHLDQLLATEIEQIENEISRDRSWAYQKAYWIRDTIAKLKLDSIDNFYRNADILINQISDENTGTVESDKISNSLIILFKQNQQYLLDEVTLIDSYGDNIEGFDLIDYSNDSDGWKKIIALKLVLLRVRYSELIMIDRTTPSGFVDRLPTQFER